jgi:predicted metal-dependent hydrolase
MADFPMTIDYILKRSKRRRKTISLQISGAAEIVVSAPYFTKDFEISRFVQEKQNWIQQAIRKQKEALVQNREKEFICGEYFHYLGQAYPLEVFYQQKLPAGLVFWGSRFYLNCPDHLSDRKCYFIEWYKTKARQYFVRQVEDLGRKLGLLPRNVRITSARSRWGSCSEENNLAFSFRLIMAPPAVIDYVIIHELMHIKEKNHSAGFWKLMETAMPQYKTQRRWLKENGHKFSI